MLESFREVGANFALKLPSRTQFAKFKDKKVIAENQCEKLIKSRFLLELSVSGFPLHNCIEWPNYPYNGYYACITDGRQGSGNPPKITN